MIRTVLRTALFTVVAFALMAPAAFAGEHDGGEGLWGETNDKVITYAGFILIVGIPILILILTLVQSSLERRKDRRLAAAKARKARADLRGGW
jgi:membrane protease YdiL (CAAX protease family)